MRAVCSTDVFGKKLALVSRGVSACSSRWQSTLVVPSLLSETPYIIEAISIVRF